MHQPTVRTHGGLSWNKRRKKNMWVRPWLFISGLPWANNIDVVNPGFPSKMIYTLRALDIYVGLEDGTAYYKPTYTPIMFGDVTHLFSTERTS
jgi:hypothetical protein